MAIGDKDNSYIISGTGDVLEPEGDVIGIGSGGNYALAAGKVLIGTDMSAEEVAKKAIEVATPPRGGIFLLTNLFSIWSEDFLNSMYFAAYNTIQFTKTDIIKDIIAVL